MDNEELEYWGTRGREANWDTLRVSGDGLSGDIIMLWRVVGELVARVRHLEEGASGGN